MNHRTCIYSSLALFLAIAGTVSSAQDSLPEWDSRLAYLEHEVPQLMSRNAIPGLALALVRIDGESLLRTCGVRKTRTREPLLGSTPMEAASISKTMFALAAMNLAQQGVLDLDAPLYEISEFDSIVSDERRKRITARMILAHTSGLPNALPPGESPSIGFEPGSQFRYSGWGYRYLQQVVEELTGRNLDDLMREQVYEPIGLNRTGYLWREEFEFSAADGHRGDGEFGREIIKFDREYAEGGIITTIDDLARYAEYTLEAIDANSALMQSIVDPAVEIRSFGVDGKMSWSMGWGVEETALGRSIWHTGSYGEFKAFIILDVSRSEGLAVMINSENGLDLIPELVSSLMGEHHLVDEYSPSALSSYSATRDEI